MMFGGAMRGGGSIRKHAGRIAAAAAALVILGTAFYFVNAFTGNPVSAWIAARKIRDYAAATYPELDLELSETRYNFKNSAYGCRAQSKTSEDTNFYIGYGGGEVTDDYAYEVANHYTTLRRLSREFDDMVTAIVEGEYPHTTTMVLGDMMGDSRLLTPDAPLDLNRMPLQLTLSVSVLCEEQTDGQMAALLLELHRLMLSRGIAIDRYTLRLEEPVPEDGKPSSGNNLYLDDYPAENVSEDTERLALSIGRHRAAVEERDKE